MRLLVKSRKKYHGSIMKCYRSIIKDCTMHEKKQFKHRKDPKEYCPKTSPIFGHSLPTLWAIAAQHTVFRCPRGGLRMPV